MFSDPASWLAANAARAKLANVHRNPAVLMVECVEEE
jgi:hypothetical protein